MAESGEIEMKDYDINESENLGIEETDLDFPDVPLENKDTYTLQKGFEIEAFVESTRKALNIDGQLHNFFYKGLTVDEEGYVYYKNKRIQAKKGNRDILNTNTLQKIETV
jgi:hypothetical protein